MKNIELFFFFWWDWDSLLMFLLFLFSFVLFLQLKDIAVIPAQLNPVLNQVEFLWKKPPLHRAAKSQKDIPSYLLGILVSLHNCRIFFYSFVYSAVPRTKKRCCGERNINIFNYCLLCRIDMFTIVYSTLTGGYKMLYPFIYLFSMKLTYVLGYFFCRVSLEHKNQHLKRKLAHEYPSSFEMILWMMAGMITESYWAIPVVTSHVAAVCLFHPLLGFYYSPERNWDIIDQIKLTLLSILLRSVISLQFFFLLLLLFFW